MSPKRPFGDDLNIGREGERIVCRWMQRQGCGVIPLSEIRGENGMGPRAFAEGRSTVLPDLHFYKHGENWMGEVKTKTVFSWSLTLSDWSTGIDDAYFEEYLRIRRESGIDLHVMFLHISAQPNPRDIGHCGGRLCPTGLFSANIDHLAEQFAYGGCGYRRHDKTGTKMAYWSHAVLTPIATYDEVEAATGGSIERLRIRMLGSVASEPALPIATKAQVARPLTTPSLFSDTSPSSYD